MARSKHFIEQDIEDCNRAIAQTSPSDKEWNWLVRRRHELLIELRHAEVPVHKEPAVQWIYLPSKFNN